MLSTPYYRTLTLTHSLGCDDLPDANYVPYDIFCLETRLYPLVYSLLNHNTQKKSEGEFISTEKYAGIQLLFKTVFENQRMELKIEIQKIVHIENDEARANSVIDLSEEVKQKLQNKVNEITSKYIGYCIIDHEQLYLSARRKYPLGWFNSVLRYVPLSSAYLPFYHESATYLMFNEYSDYKTQYNIINNYILDTIDTYYEQGVIYGASAISKNWNLERLDISEVVSKLYKPLWSDKRVAPDITSFLLERLQGNKFIRIKVSDNLVKRHKIILEMSKYRIPVIFENGYIKIECNNIEDAQYFASIVHAAENTAVGQVITKKLDSMEMVNLYVDTANKLLNYPECVGYQTSNTNKNFVFSCLVPINSPSELILDKIGKSLDVEEYTEKYEKK